MRRSVVVLGTIILLTSHIAAWSQDKPPPARPEVRDGAYAVVRHSLQEKDVLPLADGEVLLVDRHRYAKKDESEPPRFVVVRAAAGVALDLAAEPKAIKEEDGKGLRLLLKLRPGPARDLERLTKEHIGRPVAIVVGGELVTMHKIKEVIKGGEVQITSCTPGGAEYLLEKLQARSKSK
jgi:preprotein translocase subunit SecD